MRCLRSLAVGLLSAHAVSAKPFFSISSPESIAKRQVLGDMGPMTVWITEYSDCGCPATSTPPYSAMNMNEDSPVRADNHGILRVPIAKTPATTTQVPDIVSTISSGPGGIVEVSNGLTTTITSTIRVTKYPETTATATSPNENVVAFATTVISSAIHEAVADQTTPAGTLTSNSVQSDSQGEAIIAAQNTNIASQTTGILNPNVTDISVQQTLAKTTQRTQTQIVSPTTIPSFFASSSAVAMSTPVSSSIVVGNGAAIGAYGSAGSSSVSLTSASSISTTSSSGSFPTTSAKSSSSASILSTVSSATQVSAIPSSGTSTSSLSQSPSTRSTSSTLAPTPASAPVSIDDTQAEALPAVPEAAKKINSNSAITKDPVSETTTTQAVTKDLVPEATTTPVVVQEPTSEAATMPVLTGNPTAEPTTKAINTDTHIWPSPTSTTTIITTVTALPQKH